MKFEVSAKLAYEALSPSTLILNIEPFKSRGQFVVEESFVSNLGLKMYDWTNSSGEKRFKVIEIPKTGLVEINYKGIVENQLEIVSAALLEDVPISLMPVYVLNYLNPSRYCQSDKFYKFALHKFGAINSAYEKVMAVRDWIYDNVEYNGGGYSTPQTSAYDTVTEQIGVCRDFAHLGIALCRALTIPARYFTAYAYKLQPADFHACFEVYLGGRWVIVDATKLVPLNGLVKIATGIDATDTALASIFGNLNFQSMEVNAVSLDPNFTDADGSSLMQGYSYY
ncbi:transglutaminase-like domain-containing protein [Pedobacter metabolipauper]|uniref:Transglutaminase superfamily protein n=1 Tax=Pedobacter metabolipauper TaxID=425513 RepID=A0A4R6T032_9SPHI|nr:transglutaminase family protein [Pedobacter metabolipauper]TDQ10314.1 transglutaminase superfamily protein [Pedobacter metabolipauper]